MDILDLGYLSDQEAQTEEVGPSCVEDDVATEQQLQVTPDEEERNRNRFVRLLAWSQIQGQASRKLKFQPLPKKPARRKVAATQQPGSMAQSPNQQISKSNLQTSRVSPKRKTLMPM